MTDEELSRRRWLLRLGETVVLSGFSGIDLKAASDTTPLPPGLYGPSLNHLTHVMKANSEPRPGPFTPQFFSEDDFKVIQRLASLMLGENASTQPVPEICQWIDLLVSRSADVQRLARSLTPAQHRLALDYFGEHSVTQLEHADAQPLCRKGLEQMHRQAFLNLPEAEQIARLTQMEKDRDPFILWMKARVIEGFYTSREGLKELDYKGNSFYAESPGCNHQNQG
jgi:hypothetical protein